MPVYCYRLENGEPLEIEMSVKEKEDREIEGIITLENGITAFRDIVAEHRGTRHCPGNWPMHSCAMGVGIDQVQEAQEYSRKIGVPTEFDSQTGDAIFTSPAHRKRYCEAHGFIDRNGGFSDPQTDRSSNYEY